MSTSSISRVKALKKINSFRKIFPYLIFLLNKQDRYRPKIEWSDKSWVHNVFRVYEAIFWRKVGIREESSVWIDNEVEYHRTFTIEAFLAYTETYIRSLWRRKKFIKIQSMQFAIPNQKFSVPLFSFAIALDVGNAGTTNTSSPITWSHTVTGSNPFLYVGPAIRSSNSTPGTVSAVTYAAAALTSARADSNAGSFASSSSVWFKGSPATGANTVSVTFGSGFSPSCGAGSTSYSGAQSSSVADAVNGTTATSGTGAISFNVTTVADNCWVVCTLSDASNGADTATQTSRWEVLNGGNGRYGGEDSNGAKTPAGARAMGWTINAGNFNGYSMTGASFAPAAAGGTTAHNLTLLGVGS